jgi:hypothetical protein
MSYEKDKTSVVYDAEGIASKFQIEDHVLICSDQDVESHSRHLPIHFMCSLQLCVGRELKSLAQVDHQIC